MYNLIKTASETYASATGKDPIAFAKRLTSKLGFTAEEERRMIEKLKSEEETNRQNKRNTPKDLGVSKDFAKPSKNKTEDDPAFKKLEEEYSKAVQDDKITMADKSTYSVGNLPKFEGAIRELVSFFKGVKIPFETVPRIAESQVDRSAIMGFTMALEDLIGDLKDAKKETTTGRGGRTIFRYDIKSDNFKDAYNLLRKLPVKTKDGKPFRGWLIDNFLPYFERDIKVKGKTKKVLDYGQTFRAQELGHSKVRSEFIKPIQRDIRDEMNKTRVTYASMIRKLANRLLKRAN
jgi:hypothetical protein